MSNLEVAVNFAKAGYSVFPCEHHNRPKRPLCIWKTEATANLEIINRWWTRFPNALVGLPTGIINGLTVLDIDVKNDVNGLNSLISIGFDTGSYKGHKVVTPTGGFHLYFQYNSRIKNSAGKLGPGLDIRSEGGYVIAAGWIPNVGRYEVLS